MNGKWRLLVLAALLCISVITAMAAFAVPWSWTRDQSLLLWLALCAAVVLGIWVAVWLRGGNQVVTVRWKRTLGRTGTWKKRFWQSLWFWVGLAVVLVFIFNMTQH